MNESKLLSELKHPFIVNMVYAFQDRTNLYLIMDYMPGGDLRFQIGRVEKFPEHIVKFFVCSIILSLKYLHENNPKKDEVYKLLTSILSLVSRVISVNIDAASRPYAAYSDSIKSFWSDVQKDMESSDE